MPAHQSNESEFRPTSSVAYYYSGEAMTGRHGQRPNAPIYTKPRKKRPKTRKQKHRAYARRMWWHRWRMCYHKGARFRRSYSGTSPITRKRVRRQVAALLAHAYTNDLHAFFSTLSFRYRWHIPDTVAREVLRSLCLRYKYLDRKTGASTLWVAVAERQTNGTIHFHMVSTHKFRYIDAKKVQQKLRQTLSRLNAKHSLGIPQHEIDIWNGYDLEKVKDLKPKQTQKIGNYVSKQARSIGDKMGSYMSKQRHGESSYECMAYASSYSVKNLPVGECHSTSVYELFNAFTPNPYVTVWRFDPYGMFEGQGVVLYWGTQQPEPDT